MSFAVSILEQGLIYGILALGIYITYKILDFPDLTVDGSFPLGAAVTALMITPLPDNYKRLIRDNIRQLLEKIPPEMGEK
jgi:putative tryptophan/tyrosine transport system permease protein